ncbi:Signal transduction histidine kinase [Geodermatophilus pulveris]|uniref:histidine kinase n=1 Tax=Geodermatophilus pulveris TaxID=1564159 RepID=A0A239FUB9_9ACTN|nr:sensor histidine kinase [Geodermatophilus pulveris]SNS60420.1 Signal transduction histidine kinase [Geodermatophilus pulveris]
MERSGARWVGWWRARPLAVDAVLTALVLAVSLQPLLRAEGCGCAPVPGWAPLLVLAECLPLLGRRLFPFGSALVVGLVTTAHGLLPVPEPVVPFAGLVAVHAVAAHATRRQARLAAGVAALAITASLLLDQPASEAEDAAVLALTFTTAWLLGDAARHARERAAVLEQRAAEAERTRAAEAGRAVVEERNRIAREMHDVLAHSVSLMVVQAEAGPVVVRRDPDRAVAAFDAVSATGRQALAELRRLLGVLRDDRPGGDAPGPLAPQAGLDRVPELVERVRGAGADAALTYSGLPGALPAAVDLAAYRIVQEALTNAVKHAGPARIEVRLTGDGTALTVQVRDDGLGSPVPAAPGEPVGRGLIGMRERAGSLGGSVSAGPLPGGGWQVLARLPLAPVPAATTAP